MCKGLQVAVRSLDFFPLLDEDDEDEEEEEEEDDDAMSMSATGSLLATEDGSLQPVTEGDELDSFDGPRGLGMDGSNDKEEEDGMVLGRAVSQQDAGKSTRRLPAAAPLA